MSGISQSQLDDKRYKIVFEGKLSPGKSKNDACRLFAAALKTEEEYIKPVFNNNEKWLIAKNLTPEKAKKYSQVFLKAGLICEIKPEGFDIQSIQFCKFKKYSFVPRVFSKRQNLPVKDKKDNLLFFIRSKRFIIGRLLALFLVFSFTCPLQWKMTVILIHYIGTSWKTSLISFILFVLILFLSYSLIIGRKHVMFYLKNGREKPFFHLFMADRFRLNWGFFSVTDENGNLLAKLRRNIHQDTVTAYDPHGSQICRFEKIFDINDIMLNTAVEIRKKLIDSKFLDKVQKKIRIKKRGRVKRYAIIQPDGTVIGVFKNLNTCSFFLPGDSSNLTDRRIIMALTVVTAGF